MSKNSRKLKKSKSRERAIKQAKDNHKKASQINKGLPSPKANDSFNESMEDFINAVKSPKSLEYEYSLNTSKNKNKLELIGMFDNTLRPHDVKNMLSLNLDHIDIFVDISSPMQISMSDYEFVQKAIHLKREGMFEESFQIYQDLYNRIGASHVLCKAWAKTSVLCKKYDLAIKLFRSASFIMSNHHNEVDFQSLGGAAIVFMRASYKSTFKSYLTGIKGIPQNIRVRSFNR